MAMKFDLKPFIFNLNDINFILDQVNFQPLFSGPTEGVDRNAIINWDGTGAIYDNNGNQLWDGTFTDPNNPNILSTQDALNAFGTSYAHVTSFEGIREVSGNNNNLLLVNYQFGAADAEFVRTLGANYNFLNMDLTAPLVIPVQADLATVAAVSTTVSSSIDLAVTTGTGGTLTFFDPSTSSFILVPINFNNVVREVTDVTTSTKTIDGGHLFASWNELTVTTQTHVDQVIVDVDSETIT